MTAPRVLLATLLVLAFGLGGIPAATAAPGPSYIAVIDAGSSGTRLALFEQGTGVSVTQIFRAPKKTPGLSSFAPNASAAGPDAVRPLLDQ